MRRIFGIIVLAAVIGLCVCGCDEEKKQAGVEKENDKLMETQMGQEKQAAGSKVRIKTSMGDMVVELNAEKAPVTVANFMSYVNEGFFSGTIFHRVIPGFMIQGGGFTADMDQKATKAAIKLESNNGLKNMRGTIAMARTNRPDSATGQFFINVKDNDFLNYSGPSNPGYAVFGKVVEGMDVADKIVSVKTTEKDGMGDVPVETVLIESVEVVK